jgi:Uma2 family endonuclease
MTQLSPRPLPSAYVRLPRSLDAEQNMAMPAQPAKRWTADEARQLNEANPNAFPRYEVIDGELLVMRVAPRLAHQRAVDALYLRLHAYVTPRHLGEVLTGPAEIELELDSMVSPDLFTIPPDSGARVEDWSGVRSLVLVVEILSPSTAHHDRVVKRDYFMRNDVGEYWIVDLDGRLVERWRRGDVHPEILSDELLWQPVETIDPFILNLPDFFAVVLDG